MTDQQAFILEEMAEVRAYCALIHRARQKAGFVSLKYPITDVLINRYFLPEHRKLIAEECNIVGYMQIPPVEYDPDFVGGETYHKEAEGSREVWLSTVRSDWQEDIYQERMKRRDDAEARKQSDQ